MNNFFIFISVYLDRRSKKGTVSWSLFDGDTRLDDGCFIEADQTSTKAYLNGLLDAVKASKQYTDTQDVCSIRVFIKEEGMKSYTDNILLSIAQCWKIVKEGGALNKHRRNIDEKQVVIDQLLEVKESVPDLTFRVSAASQGHAEFATHFSTMRKLWVEVNEKNNKSGHKYEALD